MTRELLRFIYTMILISLNHQKIDIKMWMPMNLNPRGIPHNNKIHLIQQLYIHTYLHMVVHPKV